MNIRLTSDQVSDLVEATKKEPKLLDRLTPRELYIFEEYCVKGGKALKKLAEEVSNLYGVTVSAERVRQLKVRALRKLIEAKLREKNNALP